MSQAGGDDGGRPRGKEEEEEEEKQCGGVQGVQGVQAVTPPPTTGLLTFELPTEARKQFETWRDRVLSTHRASWVKTRPTPWLKDVATKLPAPHITLFFDCALDGEVARSTVVRHLQHTPLTVTAAGLHTGKVSPVLLLRLQSPGMVKLFHELHRDAAVNPKGDQTRHCLFDYAKHEGGNTLGFVPHVTLAWFNNCTSAELEDALGGTLPPPPQGLSFDLHGTDVVYKSW